MGKGERAVWVHHRYIDAPAIRCTRHPSSWAVKAVALHARRESIGAQSALDQAWQFAGCMTHVRERSAVIAPVPVDLPIHQLKFPTLYVPLQSTTTEQSSKRPGDATTPLPGRNASIWVPSMLACGSGTRRTTSCSREEGLVVLHDRGAFMAAVVSHDVRVALHWLVERFSSKVLELLGSGTEFAAKAATLLKRTWHRGEGSSNSFKQL
jgi:hypothetical protein